MLLSGDIDSISIKPDRFGWRITITCNGHQTHTYDIGDAIQFHDEVERTIGRWLADGPADFHAGTDSTEPIYVREDTDHGR